jgi:hypothetical protein
MIQYSHGKEVAVIAGGNGVELGSKKTTAKSMGLFHYIPFL